MSSTNGSTYDDEYLHNTSTVLGTVLEHEGTEDGFISETVMMDERHRGDEQKYSLLAYACVVLGISVCLVSMVTVTLGLKGDDTSSGNISKQGLQQPSTDIRIDYAPIDVDVICSPIYTASKQGLFQCDSQCSVSKCCYLSQRNPSSCLIQYYKQCISYMPHCDDTWGDPEGNDGNYHKDMRKWEATGNVRSPPQASSDITDVCTNPSRRDECISECAPAACCFASQADATESAQLFLSENIRSRAKYNNVGCYEGYRGICDGYNICKTLTPTRTAESEWIALSVPHAPYRINAVCTYANIANFEGRSECKEMCDSAKCCTTSVESKNCKENNFDVCEEYSSCEVLVVGQYET